MTVINVFGAGAFGTALAISLTKGGQRVQLIPRDPSHLGAMRQARENTRRLPGHEFPQNLMVEANPNPSADISLLAVPTKALESVVHANSKALAEHYTIACCKGIDLHTGLGPTGIIKRACPDTTVAILSGPSFAIDIASELPTALTLAASTEEIASKLQNLLTFANIRLYRSIDMLGVELGGALKNVIAIAAGITIGAGLGESARAALMARGYHEMKQFAALYGASPETLSGLSGFGDLVLTCTSEKSRNYSHGLLLGRGLSSDSEQTIEGIQTAAAVAKIAKENRLDIPLLTSIAAFLAGETTLDNAILTLLARPLTKE